VAAELTSQPHAGVVDVFGEDGRREPRGDGHGGISGVLGAVTIGVGVSGGVSPLARGTALTRWSYRRSSVRMTPPGKCQGGGAVSDAGLDDTGKLAEPAAARRATADWH
jgi:hypothetical protein